jgi:hypothetical protein
MTHDPKWARKLAQAELLLEAFHAERAELLRDALVEHDWYCNRAAEALGKSTNTLRRWLCKYPELRAEYNREKRGGLRFVAEVGTPQAGSLPPSLVPAPVTPPPGAPIHEVGESGGGTDSE